MSLIGSSCTWSSDFLRLIQRSALLCGRHWIIHISHWAFQMKYDLSFPLVLLRCTGLVRTICPLLTIVQPPSRDAHRTIYMFLCPWNLFYGHVLLYLPTQFSSLQLPLIYNHLHWLLCLAPVDPANPSFLSIPDFFSIAVLFILQSVCVQQDS